MFGSNSKPKNWYCCAFYSSIQWRKKRGNFKTSQFLVPSSLSYFILALVLKSYRLWNLSFFRGLFTVYLKREMIMSVQSEFQHTVQNGGGENYWSSTAENHRDNEGSKSNIFSWFALASLMILFGSWFYYYLWSVLDMSCSSNRVQE